MGDRPLGYEARSFDITTDRTPPCLWNVRRDLLTFCPGHYIDCCCTRPFELQAKKISSLKLHFVSLFSLCLPVFFLLLFFFLFPLPVLFFCRFSSVLFFPFSVFSLCVLVFGVACCWIQRPFLFCLAQGQLVSTLHICQVSLWLHSLDLSELSVPLRLQKQISWSSFLGVVVFESLLLCVVAIVVFYVPTASCFTYLYTYTYFTVSLKH